MIIIIPLQNHRLTDDRTHWPAASAAFKLFKPKHHLRRHGVIEVSTYRNDIRNILHSSVPWSQDYIICSEAWRNETNGWVKVNLKVE